jgi:EAL domain-containing protein (putative c-di-GMP-specific phosphodiesterase class I)
MEQPDVARATLEKCRDIGLRIAIDDFGTGYSSLSYLNRFPIDIIKIDQSFVGSMLKNEGSWKIVNSIVALAHGLGMRIVAEGIEQEEQHTALKDLGCTYAQGYLHSPPLPLDAACEFLEKRLMS